MSLMTQSQLAEKYHERRAVIAAIISDMEIMPETKTIDRYPKYLYQEKYVVSAMIQFYTERSNNHLQRAEQWTEKARSAYKKFYNGGTKE